MVDSFELKLPIIGFLKFDGHSICTLSSRMATIATLKHDGNNLIFKL